MDFVFLFGALVVILIGAEGSTNALEHLGERLRLLRPWHLLFNGGCFLAYIAGVAI